MWLVRRRLRNLSAFGGDNDNLVFEATASRDGQTKQSVDPTSQDESHISTSPASLRASSAPPTFCKCTCFKNSTIVALGPQHQDGKSGTAPSRRDPASSDIHGRAASSSCSQCTKAFCLGSGIDFCRDATEEDVQTMCFQRDSNKDRVIVWGFILGTAGLLGWAALKRVNELREGKRAAEAARAGAGRGDYSPLAPPTSN
ncbi:hypothetical protein ColTof4_03682 [Colletotrichum tofieldiae]|nr:hypothetical protein ColTof3_12890 [Colletotrichum tofieldiae]GKT71259.1 hypothetical protein ColTof4_03682 [Colletotrichum tofieldiae]